MPIDIGIDAHFSAEVELEFSLVQSVDRLIRCPDDAIHLLQLTQLRDFTHFTLVVLYLHEYLE